MIALIGTPAPFSKSGSRTGLLRTGAVMRLLGCAAFSFEWGVLSDLHPSNVVADGSDFPTGKMFWRNQHGEIRFAAGARERCRYVMFFSFGRFDSKDQHVLGHPALFAREIGTDSQCETFFAQQ